MNKIILQIYKTLLEEYGPQGWWPVYSLRNTECRDARGYFIEDLPIGTSSDLLGQRREGSLLPTILPPRGTSKFEIAIGAILTQNTAWTNVEKALANLIKQNILDPNKIMDIDQKELAELIRSSGYYNQKAKKLKKFTHYLQEGNFFRDGNIPARENLLELWGIGKETADSILLYAYKVPVFVVDTYTIRIFKRLGLLEGKEKYDEITKLFTENLKTDYLVFQEYHALIVYHAKEHCRKKPICEACVLNKICKKNI